MYLWNGIDILVYLILIMASVKTLIFLSILAMIEKANWQWIENIRPGFIVRLGRNLIWGLLIDIFLAISLFFICVSIEYVIQQLNNIDIKIVYWKVASEAINISWIIAFTLTPLITVHIFNIIWSIIKAQTKRNFWNQEVY